MATRLCDLPRRGSTYPFTDELLRGLAAFVCEMLGCRDATVGVATGFGRGGKPLLSRLRSCTRRFLSRKAVT